MTEYTLIVNTTDCVGCCACEVACKQEHNLPVGPGWIKVRPAIPQIINGRPHLRYAVAHCMHCFSPSCRDACAVGAISKRNDGIVLVDEELCTGCRACVESCPLEVMQFDAEKEVAQKCDLCAERLDKGLSPACVAVCPGHCIYFGDIKEIKQRLGEQELLVRYKSASCGEH